MKRNAAGATAIERTSRERDDLESLPGHWLLACLGKRVLRPGGLAMTHGLLDDLRIGPEDRVVEFAPGLGVTARLTLQRWPARYTAIEPDPDACEMVSRYLVGSHQVARIGSAQATGLPGGDATVVYGEAMLTMQSDRVKAEIVREAARILEAGGRYGIHEMALVPDDVDEELKARVREDLSRVIRVNARPLTIGEWSALLEAEGFRVVERRTTPFRLLDPVRLVEDEGLTGALRFAGNVARNATARRRVLAMRAVFARYRPHLTAVAMVARRP